MYMTSSILFILVSDILYENSFHNINLFNNYILELKKLYIVDVALIVSNSKYFDYYDNIIEIKYKYCNNNKQLSKVCDFITNNSLCYDWYVKTRPEIEIKEYLNFDKFCSNSINGRVREYVGPLRIENGTTLRGIGFLPKEQFTNEILYNNKLTKITMDDTIYIFHNNVIINGGFDKLNNNNQKENEWFHTLVWNSRNINLNVVGIDCLFTYFEEIKIKLLKNENKVNYYYSGNVNL